MNMIIKKINFQEIKPILIEAFTSVYGKHNQRTIEERLNKIIFIPYIRQEDIQARYYNELKQFKQNLFIKLIQTFRPNVEISSEMDLFRLYKGSPDFYKQICLLLGDENYEVLYRYPDFERDYTSYRIPELFDEEKYSNLSNYEKGWIDKKRVKVLNGLGFKITMEEYLECLTNNSLNQYIKKIQRYIDVINQLDDEYISFLKQHNEVIQFIASNHYTTERVFQECRQQIESANLLTDGIYTYENIENGIPCCIPGISYTNGKMDSICIVYFPTMDSSHDGKRDLTLVHEIQHAIETQLMDIKPDYAVFKSGFDTVKEEFIGKNMQDESDEERKREFELLSETMHQQIAKEVVKYLHDRNIYIFGEHQIENDPNINLSRTSPYDDFFPIVEPYYLKYKTILLDARLSYVALKKFFTSTIESEFKSINTLVNEANKLSGLFGVDQNTVEYKNLVKRAKMITGLTESEPTGRD